VKAWKGAVTDKKLQRVVGRAGRGRTSTRYRMSPSLVKGAKKSVGQSRKDEKNNILRRWRRGGSGIKYRRDDEAVT
jgi:hypothetical protein